VLLRTVDAAPWEIRADAAEDEPALELRYDRAELLKPVRLPNGTLVAEGFVAKEGILEYPRGDGTVRREFVPESCLKESADTLSDLPLTLLHPDAKTYPQGVTPKNVGKLGIGNTGEVVHLLNGGHTKLHIAVRHQDGIDAIEKDGMRELSLGYAVQIDNTPGVHPVHGRYDCVQVRRVHNHVALVPRGRFGPEVGMRADAAYSTETITGATPNAGSPAPTPNPTHHDGGSVRIVLLEIARHLGLGDQRFDTDESLAKAISVAVQARNDADEAAEATLAQLRADAEAHAATLKAEKERGDREKARADAAELAATNLREADKARADKAEREEIEGLAKELHLDAAGFPLLKDLRRAIASAQKGEQIKADASDDYVQAYLDEARKASKVRADGRDAGKNAWAPPAMRGQAGPGNRRNDTNGPATGGYTPPPAPSGRPSGFSRVRARQDSLRGDGQRNGGEG
jgi:hypothetical protein